MLIEKGNIDIMIDSHIHLSDKRYNQNFPFVKRVNETYTIEYGNRDQLILLAKEAGVTCCIEPAIDVDSNRLLLNLAAKYPGFVYPAVGNHPTRCIQSHIRDFRRVKEFASNKNVIAIGETGLDYHYERKEQHRIRQKIWFRWQIGLADKLRLPLILHIRMAHDDAIKILRKNRAKLHGGVCHCFVGDASVARIYTEELGLCLGIGGSLLMRPKISEPLCEAVKETPAKYLLLETDGPFVKPMRPENIIRKKWEKARNTSLILPSVANRIAELKNLPVEDVLRITEENTKRVFSLGQV